VSQDKQKCSEESPEILTSMLGFPMQLEWNLNKSDQNI
jgi:hypothetical protein